MEATELRTKNLVLNDNCICEVIHIYGGSFTHCTLKTKQGNEINANYALLNPIPLTEEILLKCGFKKTEEYYASYEENIDVYTILGFNIAFIDNEYKLWICIEEDPFYSFSWTKIKYVHQLQNLYFSLTGQELEINL